MVGPQPAGCAHCIDVLRIELGVARCLDDSTNQEARYATVWRKTWMVQSLFLPSFIHSGRPSINQSIHEFGETSSSRQFDTLVTIDNNMAARSVLQ